MKGYLFLAIAIMFELFGTSMLKASEGFTRLFPSLGVIVGFIIAFYSLSLSLQQVPLGIAYAIWSGVGTAITTIIATVIWKEHINLLSLIGIVLIISGVVILNLKTPLHEHMHT